MTVKRRNKIKNDDWLQRHRIYHVLRAYYNPILRGIIDQMKDEGLVTIRSESNYPTMQFTTSGGYKRGELLCISSRSHTLND